MKLAKFVHYRVILRYSPWDEPSDWSLLWTECLLNGLPLPTSKSSHLRRCRFRLRLASQRFDADFLYCVLMSCVRIVANKLLRSTRHVTFREQSETAIIYEPFVLKLIARVRAVFSSLHLLSMLPLLFWFRVGNSPQFHPTWRCTTRIVHPTWNAHEQRLLKFDCLCTASWIALACR